MDKIQKALEKFSGKEKILVKATLAQLQKKKFTGLDIQKLKGHRDIFRVRKGTLRIIYRQLENGVMIMAIERRSEKTYRNF